MISVNPHLKGKLYDDFKLVKEGEFRQLCYDKKVYKIFAQGVDKIWQSSDGKKWRVYQSNEPIDFIGIANVIKQ